MDNFEDNSDVDLGILTKVRNNGPELGGKVIHRPGGQLWTEKPFVKIWRSKPSFDADCKRERQTLVLVDSGG